MEAIYKAEEAIVFIIMTLTCVIREGSSKDTENPKGSSDIQRAQADG